VLGALYFQIGLGLSVDHAGLLIIPMMVANTLASNWAGREVRRIGRYRRTALLMAPLTLGGLVVMAFLADSAPVWLAAVVLTIAPTGIGPIFPSSMVAVQNAVEPRDLGAITGAIGFARALGGAVVLAASSALVLGVIAAALPELGPVAHLEDL